MGGMQFRDRVDAGRRLAASLRADSAAGVDANSSVVLGLPRGGVPVAFEIARDLGAPLDVILVRKLGVPTQPELAMGAIGEDGVQVLNKSVLQSTRVSKRDLDAVIAREREELERRAIRIRAVRSREPLRGRTAVIVDDGIATGATMRAACEVARAAGAGRVVVAAPIAPPSAIAQLSEVANAIVVTDAPARFFAIGEFYRDFSATTEDEVLQLLQR